MSFFDELQSATAAERQALYATPVIREALAGQVSLEGYRAFLTQAFNPLTLNLAALVLGMIALRGRPHA